MIDPSHAQSPTDQRGGAYPPSPQRTDSPPPDPPPDSPQTHGSPPGPSRSDTAPPTGPHSHVTTPLRSPFDRRTWTRTLDALLDLPIGAAGFAYVAVLLSFGLGTAITVLGFPVLAATVIGGRGWAAAERARAFVLLGERTPEPPGAPCLSGNLGWIKTGLTDAPGWRALLYLVLLLPFGMLSFSLTVSLWAVTLGTLSYPLWYFHLPPGGVPELWEDAYLDTFGESLLMTAFGVAMLFLVPPLFRGISDIRRALVRGLL